MRTVVVVLYDGFQSLDAFGPIEVLGGAPRAYEVTVVAPRAGAVRASNGISVNVERGISEVTGSIRLEVVRTELETTTLTISAIARRCGFGTAETLHRAFQRRLRITPADDRARFRARAA